ncbi:hypothetical protein Q7O_004419 [Pectobacterium carotovorum subsp. carotovorum PCCS1]|nr:hypothetical protein [Pectobacterium carotovorum subsp. carotovorum PCCS1]
MGSDIVSLPVTQGKTFLQIGNNLRSFGKAITLFIILKENLR